MQTVHSRVRDALVEELKNAGLNVTIELDKHECGEGTNYVSKSGCQGFCQQGPLVHIEPDDILYVMVKPEDVAEIVEKTFKNNEVIDRLLYKKTTDW